MNKHETIEETMAWVQTLEEEHGVSFLNLQDLSPGIDSKGKLVVTFTKKFTYDIAETPKV